MYVVSNIDLVTLLGFNSYSKTIHIVREHSMNLYDFVSQSISALDQFDGKWSNASSLIFKTTLNMQPVNMDPGRFETQNIFTFERLNQLASSITVQMPNLVHVCAAQNNDIGLITVVANRVVSAIAFQVKHLTTKVYRYIYAGSFSRNLTNLGLTFAPAAIQNIPKVCAPTLKRLELFGVFQNFSWNSFGDDSYAHCLAFSNLEALCIHFVDGPDMLQNNKSMAVVLGNDFIKSFNFPKLRYLDINHTITSSTFLHYANFPSKLPCLEIHLSPNDSVLIRDVPFGAAERRELAKHFSNFGIKTETIKLTR
ncbi:hypothetical protein LPJ72_005635 [Coemansia sp. Benny D160-2]|nr:hypothetical protein LPJ72_005635 [Coemansia sp. Benny D160-2]